MNPLSLIPTTWLLPAAAVVGAALLATAGVQTWRLHTEQAARATDRASMAEERLLASRVTLLDEQRNRAEEQRRRDEQQEKIDAAEKTAERDRADRAIAVAAAGRLSQRVTALVAAAREAGSNSQAVQPGQAASDPAGMLVDVLGRCVQRVRLLASVADERGNAGKLCEQSYDALTDAPAQ
jgi:hypothetical protein